MDWEDLLLKTFLTICIAFMLFILLWIPYELVYESKHPCIKYGAPYYHSPTYVMAGKVMVPTGGGVYGDCEARRP